MVIAAGARRRSQRGLVVGGDDGGVGVEAAPRTTVPPGHTVKRGIRVRWINAVCWI